MTDPASPAEKTPDPATAEARARRRLRAEKIFYVHLATYVVVIAALFLINALTGARWWFVWPAGGWGIGLLIHAVATFGIGGLLGPEWEDERLRELIDEERSRR